MGAGRRAAKAIGAYLASGARHHVPRLAGHVGDGGRLRPADQGRRARASSAPASHRGRGDRPGRSARRRREGRRRGVAGAHGRGGDPSRHPPRPHGGVRRGGARDHLCPRCHRRSRARSPYICCAGRLAARGSARPAARSVRGLRVPVRAVPVVPGQAGARRRRRPRRRGATRRPWRRSGPRSRSSSAAGPTTARPPSEATDPALKDLFQRMSEMEDEHLDTLHAPLPRGGARAERRLRDQRAPRSSRGWSTRRRTRPTCCALAIGFETAGGRRSSPSTWTSARRARSSASSTRSWPPRSASTSTLLTDELERFLAGKGGHPVAVAPGHVVRRSPGCRTTSSGAPIFAGHRAVVFTDGGCDRCPGGTAAAAAARWLGRQAQGLGAPSPRRTGR